MGIITYDRIFVVSYKIIIISRAFSFLLHSINKLHSLTIDISDEEHVLCREKNVCSTKRYHVSDK